MGRYKQDMNRCEGRIEEDKGRARIDMTGQVRLKTVQGHLCRQNKRIQRQDKDRTTTDEKTGQGIK